MAKFDIKRSTRKCAITGRAFEAGEEFFSTLMQSADGELVRADYCLEQWTDQQENCVGWWKTKMPDATGGRIYWAPNSVLLSYFQHVLAKPETAEIAYVMSIILIRNRSLKLLETDQESEPPEMTCRHNATRTIYKVPVVDIAPQRIKEIEEELSGRLFTEYREDSTSEDPDAEPQNES